MSKKSSFSIIGFYYFVLVFFLGSLLWWNWQLQPVDKINKETVVFVVDKGEGVSEITNRLKEQNLIKDQLSFKIWLLYSGIAKKIKAGSYYLSVSMSGKEMAMALTKGANDRWVTIVEGLRAEQIGEFLIKKGFAVNPEEWEREIKQKNLEGQLFPDSYLFPNDANQGKILEILRKNFEKKVTIGFKDELSQCNLGLKEVLILASIVEREAKTEKDRSLVAGILLKRRENDWPLQVDATVQYAIASKKCSLLASPCDWWRKSLTTADLKIISPYNTYLNKGLPPGPICNPGLSSIKAVLQPAPSAYWYYISGLDGEMHYAETHPEHQENILKYL